MHRAPTTGTVEPAGSPGDDEWAVDERGIVDDRQGADSVAERHFVGNAYFRLPLPHVLVRKSKRNARRSTNRTVSKTRNIPGVC